MNGADVTLEISRACAGFASTFGRGDLERAEKWAEIAFRLRDLVADAPDPEVRRWIDSEDGAQ